MFPIGGKSGTGMQVLWLAVPCFHWRTCPSVTREAAVWPPPHFSGGRSSQQLWAILETLLSAMELWAVARPLQKGAMPLPCIYFLSQTSQNHKNQRWLLGSQPLHFANPAQSCGWRGHGAVSLLLLTQVCLPGSRIPISLPRNLCSPQIFCSRQTGFMVCSSPILPQDTAPLPAAVKTTHSYPAECQAIHQGELLGKSAGFWPKVFAQLPKRWW